MWPKYDKAVEKKLIAFTRNFQRFFNKPCKQGEGEEFLTTFEQIFSMFPNEGQESYLNWHLDLVILKLKD